ncbi:MAG: hypothetical protein KKF89_06110 [Nanoarchaeota archaeon]|nr:hypothetical protein [Nanoarchaeota archaeon]MBU1855273.1 hypothetical protein [Nanoarchaeota archaeon]
MVEETITTSVDSLIDLLKKVSKIELEEAANKLEMPVSVVQSWVDFLVEERIIGLEYKFTTPFIYLNKPHNQTSETIEAPEVSIDQFKDDFKKKATEKQIPTTQTIDLWKNHLLQKLEKKKDLFFREARKRGFFNQEELWIEYRKKIMEM